MTDNEPGLLERMVNLDRLREEYRKTDTNESEWVAGINYIRALEAEAMRVGIMFPVVEEEKEDAGPVYLVGDRVIVHDPEYGDKPGKVTAADEIGLSIEGPNVMGSLVYSWQIAADKIDQYVSPA